MFQFKYIQDLGYMNNFGQEKFNLIIIKKLKKNIFVDRLIKVFKRFIFLLGSAAFLFILLGTIFYFNSGINYKHSPKSIFLKINDKVLNRYLGFDFRNTKNYIKRCAKHQKLYKTLRNIPKTV